MALRKGGPGARNTRGGIINNINLTYLEGKAPRTPKQTKNLSKQINLKT